MCTKKNVLVQFILVQFVRLQFVQICTQVAENGEEKKILAGPDQLGCLVSVTITICLSRTEPPPNK